MPPIDGNYVLYPNFHCYHYLKSFHYQSWPRSTFQTFDIYLVPYPIIIVPGCYRYYIRVYDHNTRNVVNHYSEREPHFAIEVREEFGAYDQ